MPYKHFEWYSSKNLHYDSTHYLSEKHKKFKLLQLYVKDCVIAVRWLIHAVLLKNYYFSIFSRKMILLSYQVKLVDWTQENMVSIFMNLVIILMVAHLLDLTSTHMARVMVLQMLPFDMQEIWATLKLMLLESQRFGFIISEHAFCYLSIFLYSRLKFLINKFH